MKYNNLKILACVGAVALGATFGTISQSQAQSVNIPVNIAVDNAIDIQAGVAMDFGEWILVIGATPLADSDTITLTLDPQTGAVAEAFVDGSDSSTAGMVAEEITAGAAGSVTIETPASASITMSSAISTQFSDTELTLSAITYSLNSAGSAPLSAPVNITTTGGAQDTIGLGGLVTVTDTASDGARPAGQVTITVSY